MDEDLELLVIASDGLWDAVPNEVNFPVTLKLIVPCSHSSIW